MLADGPNRRPDLVQGYYHYYYHYLVLECSYFAKTPRSFPSHLVCLGWGLSS